MRKASILVGQSINSNDVTTSFLWNMIALELLLTQQGEKYIDTLPKRVEAFLGWIGFWSIDNFEDRIREAYKKRSAFVHDGNKDQIAKADLLFTDDLLVNIFMNIVNFPELFGSKEAVVKFAEKIQAEHTLGLKSKVRPKQFKYLAREYSVSDYAEI